MSISLFIQRIRTHWNRQDTTVLVATLTSFVILLANCIFRDPRITVASSCLGLAILFSRPALLRPVIFGAIIAWLWPVGEWITVHRLGWWGEYTLAGPRILFTPLYCVLVGWLATTYCYYISFRIIEFGYSLRTAMILTGLSAFALGVVGENLYVFTGVWRYFATPLHIGSVPAFIPVAYGLGYAILPMLRRYRLPHAAAIFAPWLMAVCLILWLLSGFKGTPL